MSHVGRDGAAGADIGDSGGAAPDLVAVTHLGDYSGYSSAVDILYSGFQLRVIKWILHGSVLSLTTVEWSGSGLSSPVTAGGDGEMTVPLLETTAVMALMLSLLAAPSPQQDVRQEFCQARQAAGLRTANRAGATL